MAPIPHPRADTFVTEWDFVAMTLVYVVFVGMSIMLRSQSTNDSVQLVCFCRLLHRFLPTDECDPFVHLPICAAGMDLDTELREPDRCLVSIPGPLA
jgi:hypothetical protein